MGVEIERKYLVINDEWKQQVVSQSPLKQGYISDSNTTSVRVRIKNDTAFLTIKTGIGITRGEFEYSIPVADAEALLEQAVPGPCIDKIRYKVKVGNHTWDLDVFAGDNLGLVIAEIELDAEDETFEMPVWAGDEVTDQAKYYNVHLVKLPFTAW